MPSRSRKQHALFEMVAHDPVAARRTGISVKVAKDFVAADKGRDLKALPERVQKKADGGLVVPSSYPPIFRW